MSAVAVAAAVVVAALTLYAIFGGADFGGGVWDLLASGPRRDAQRDTITHAIGPVWESNHVWLIFAWVALFTCFPPAYADIATYLNAPLTLALLGIVLRGAAFVFRNFAADNPALARSWSVVFGASSIIAPFFLGDAVGAIATGRYAWTSPFALSVGLFNVALCAQVAAVFLIGETDDRALRDDLRRRAIRATIAVWVVGLIPAAFARYAEPAFFAALTGSTARVAIAIAVVLGIMVMLFVARRQENLARASVGAEAVAVLAGWFGAQAPQLVPGRWTLESAAAPTATLTAFSIAVACGAVLLIPSLLYLFTIFKVRSQA
ncbi:MAG TPA: cytochrome d ubiquinol oxidase subunit II [Candidatus Elarobacter sp.]|jgi:cytochrome d ubiquinol oxidase subunit II|nr:cytochrome d ubiquinol oxidase subunit II [Candidatus Elarobacter sp.]